jgi:hypothetical protein
MATRVDLSNIRIKDLSACKNALDAVSDPEAKFKVFDELTDKELTSVAFEVLSRIGADPTLTPNVDFHFVLRNMGPKYVSTVLATTKNCKALSDYMMSSLGNNRRMWSVCNSMDTYIDTKIFHALHRIVASKNFMYSANPKHPLHSLNQEMWKFQDYNHGTLCPCYHHIQAHLAAKIGSSPEKTTTCIKVKCDVGLGNKLFIRGAGLNLSWEKGIELKNIDNDTWIFETKEDFPNLEYKILINDTRWEAGDNHQVNRGRKVQVWPKF